MTEQVVNTVEDSQKADLRAIMNLCIAEMDILQRFGLKRSFVKKQVSKYKKLLSNPVREKRTGKIYPAVSEMHSMFHTGHLMSEMVHFLKSPKEHGWKVEAAQVLRDKLTYIDRYVPPEPPRHEDYGQFPLGHHRWVDEQGNDVWKSERKDAKLWVKRHPKVKKWHSRGKE